MTITCNYHSSYKIFQSPQKVPSYPLPLRSLLFQPPSDVHLHRSAFKSASKETPPDSMPHEYRDYQAAPSSEAKGLRPSPTLLPGAPPPAPAPLHTGSRRCMTEQQGQQTGQGTNTGLGARGSGLGSWVYTMIRARPLIFWSLWCLSCTLGMVTVTPHPPPQSCWEN